MDDEEIPEDGAIFTFGRTRATDNLPKFWIKNDPVIKIACGDEHTGLVTKSGRLFMLGNNDWGQLGLGHRSSQVKPSCVKALKGQIVRNVACGRHHTLASTVEGRLYSWGANSDHQCGLPEGGDSDNSFLNPSPITSLKPNSFTAISCGAEHSAALTENGELFVWGSNHNGQLGLGPSTREQKQPTRLNFRAKITCVSCGYYHTAFITDKNRLFVTGANESSQLGIDCDEEFITEPAEVKVPRCKFSQVSCGQDHTIALTTYGEVYAFGSGNCGELGLGHHLNLLQADTPKQIDSKHFFGARVKQVACGSGLSALLDDVDRLYTFGNGRHDRLGHGKDVGCRNEYVPRLVTKLQSVCVERVACGGCHLVVTAVPRVDSQSDENDYSSAERIEQQQQQQSGYHYDELNESVNRKRFHEKMELMNKERAKLPPLSPISPRCNNGPKTPLMSTLRSETTDDVQAHNYNNGKSKNEFPTSKTERRSLHRGDATDGLHTSINDKSYKTDRTDGAAESDSALDESDDAGEQDVHEADDEHPVPALRPSIKRRMQAAQVKQQKSVEESEEEDSGEDVDDDEDVESETEVPEPAPRASKRHIKPISNREIKGDDKTSLQKPGLQSDLKDVPGSSSANRTKQVRARIRDSDSEEEEDEDEEVEGEEEENEEKAGTNTDVKAKSDDAAGTTSSSGETKDTKEDKSQAEVTATNTADADDAAKQDEPADTTCGFMRKSADGKSSKVCIIM